MSCACQMMSSVAYSMSPPDIFNKQQSIAIIGGGLSGLTMAHRLTQKGYTNVAVYEAKSRVGGRIHTIEVQNYDNTYSIAELGGHSITDGGNAPHFLNLAKEFGLEIEDDPRCLSRGFYVDGKLYDSKELLHNSGITQETFVESLKTLPPTAKSMKDVIDHVFAGNSYLQQILYYHVGSYEGLPPEDLSITYNIDTLKYFMPGGKAVFQDTAGTDEPFVFKYIKGGNSKLPLALAEHLNGKILLEKVLYKVSRVKDRIKLEFRDETVVFCDKLILSNPCSTFADINWEDGVIPHERLDEIKEVQYGANGKIVVPLGSDRSPLYSSVNTNHIGALQSNDYKLLVFFSDGIWGKSLVRDFDSYSSTIDKMIEANYGAQKKLNDGSTIVSDKIYQYSGSVVKSWTEDPYAQGSYSVAGTGLGDRFLEQTLFQDTKFKKMFLPTLPLTFFSFA